jgi:hypothetical protein
VNLGEIKERIFRNTNHMYNDQFHMRDLVNEALKQLGTEAKVQGSTTIPLVAGTASYDVPADFKAPIAMIEGTIDNPVYVYPLVEITSSDYGYSLFNGQITFKPMPSETRTINFYYYKFLTEISADTDTPEIDLRYHDILAAYASAMILSLPGMDNVSKHLIDRYFAIWDEGKRSFQADMQRKYKVTSVRKVEGW